MACCQQQTNCMNGPMMANGSPNMTSQQFAQRTNGCTAPGPPPMACPNKFPNACTPRPPVCMPPPSNSCAPPNQCAPAAPVWVSKPNNSESCCGNIVGIYQGPRSMHDKDKCYRNREVWVMKPEDMKVDLCKIPKVCPRFLLEDKMRWSRRNKEWIPILDDLRRGMPTTGRYKVSRCPFHKGYQI